MLTVGALCRSSGPGGFSWRDHDIFERGDLLLYIGVEPRQRQGFSLLFLDCSGLIASIDFALEISNNEPADTERAVSCMFDSIVPLGR